METRISKFSDVFGAKISEIDVDKNGNQLQNQSFHGGEMDELPFLSTFLISVQTGKVSWILLQDFGPIFGLRLFARSLFKRPYLPGAFHLLYGPLWL
jgi:hypothetical protein